MTVTLRINGIDYLPIRILRLISSGVLDPDTVIDMIIHPDAFCDSKYGTVLTPYTLIKGSLSTATRASFQDASSSGFLPPGVLVRAKSAREMFNLCTNEGINCPSDIGGSVQSWNIDLLLERHERSYIFDGLPSPRRNSKSSLMADIKAGIQMIAKVSEGSGIPIDPSRLPGTSGIWHQYLKKFQCLERDISADTLKAHMKELGFRWHQGRQLVRDARFCEALDQRLALQ